MAVIWDGGVAIPVTMHELRRQVLLRDGKCVLRQLGYRGHHCAGQFDRLARDWNDGDWSLEHVTQVHSHLDVRRDDDAHCVALCVGTNTKPPNRDERDFIRKRLRSLFPVCPEVTDGLAGLA